MRADMNQRRVADLESENARLRDALERVHCRYVEALVRAKLLATMKDCPPPRRRHRFEI
jgi:hypothetical protein